MARARNIKPGFFKNEDLAECSLAARLCFAGLWTLADREGRLEDRPKRIKGDLFAYDNFDVEPLLRELVAHEFLVRYRIDGGRFIQISRFLIHQTPHYSEKPSVIKPPPLQESVGRYEAGLQESEINDDYQKPGGLQENSEKDVSIKWGSQPPDSLIPDSLIPEKEIFPIPDGTGEKERSSKKQCSGQCFPGFERFWKAYPRKVGKDAAIREFTRRKPTPELVETMIEAVAEQRTSEQWTRDPKFIPHPSTWLHDGRWQDEPEPKVADVFEGSR